MPSRDRLIDDIAAGRELNNQLSSVISNMPDEPFLAVLNGQLVDLRDMQQQILDEAEQALQTSGCGDLVREGARLLQLEVDPNWDNEEVYLHLREAVIEGLQEETNRLLFVKSAFLAGIDIDSEVIPPPSYESSSHYLECADDILKSVVDNYLVVLHDFEFLIDNADNNWERLRLIEQLRTMLGEEFDPQEFDGVAVGELQSRIEAEVQRRELETRQRELYDLFVETACGVNMREYTNMSCESLAAFMLSQVWKEAENWDRNENVPRGWGDTRFLSGDWWRHEWSWDGSRTEISYDIDRWTEEAFYDVLRFVGVGNPPNNPTRLQGPSLGIPNLYLGAVEEAFDFLFAVDPTVRDNLSYDFDQPSLVWAWTIPPVRSPFLVTLHENNEFAMESLAAVLVWAGARQRVNVGAGSEDIPALDAANIDALTENDATIRTTEEISAFSLGMVRYTDMVAAAYWNSPFWTSDEFLYHLRTVENIPDAANVLGLSDQVEPFETFIPYTGDEASCLIYGLLQAGVSAEAIIEYEFLIDAFERVIGTRPPQLPDDPTAEGYNAAIQAWEAWFALAHCR